MDRVTQQLAIVETAKRPATEIITRARPTASRQRTAVGAFLAALGLLFGGLVLLLQRWRSRSAF